MSISRQTNFGEASKTEFIYNILMLYSQKCVNKYPKCVEINQFYSMLYTYYFGNYYKSLFENMKIEKGKCKLFNRFELF